MISEAAAIASFLLGTAVSVACVASAKKRKWLHVIPFLYACLGELGIAFIQERPFQWDGALFFGACYYILGWLGVWEIRSYERKRYGN